MEFETRRNCGWATRVESAGRVRDTVNRLRLLSSRVVAPNLSRLHIDMGMRRGLQLGSIASASAHSFIILAQRVSRPGEGGKGYCEISHIAQLKRRIRAINRKRGPNAQAMCVCIYPLS